MTTSHVRAIDVEERWLVYDASQHNLGRMSARIATQLMGKDRPTYTPSETGNTHVVVINCGTPRLTGKKGEGKEYKHYTGYPGGLREVSIDRVRDKRPADIVKLAVRRMLPKNRLGHTMLKSLKVYATAEHPHAAQKPTLVESI